MTNPIRKYKPQYAKVRSWDEMEEHFTKWFSGVHQDNIGNLIRHIKSSGLSDRLFGYTSMNKLVISIYNPIEWNRESLHVEFDHINQKWHFKYHPKPDAPEEFVKTYDVNMGIEKFDNFIKLMGW
jgi:hypothetical protein